MINLELYKIFAIVAEEKNITRASEKLNISQPAVTKHIQNLEDSLQVKLFIRSNKGIELTGEGKEIYDEIKDSIETLNNIYYKYGKYIQINLGSHSTILNKLFSNQISNYYSIYNNKENDINISITNDSINNMISDLEEGKLDVVISKKTELYNKDKIDFFYIGKLHDILITKKNTKYIEKVYSLEELKDEIIYVPRSSSMTVLNFLKNTKLNESDLKLKHITYRTMIEIIDNIDGIGLVTKEYVEDELKSNRIRKLNTDFEIKPIDYGIYYRKNEENKYIKKLIAMLKNN